jgi:hypothetical protein
MIMKKLVYGLFLFLSASSFAGPFPYLENNPAFDAFIEQESAGHFYLLAIEDLGSRNLRWPRCPCGTYQVQFIQFTEDGTRPIKTCEIRVEKYPSLPPAVKVKNCTTETSNRIQN